MCNQLDETLTKLIHMDSKKNTIIIKDEKENL